MRIWPTKRFWTRLAIGAAILVALALIANGFMAWLIEHKLQAKIAAIRAAGDPASIADLAPKSIPADENAAAILQQLRPRLEEFAKEHGRFFDTPTGKAYEERRDRGEPPTPEQIQAIRSIVDKYPDLITGLAAAAACQQYSSMADFSLGSRQFLEQYLQGQIRTPARFLQWHVEVLNADGQPEEAAKRSLELLRLARLYDGEPMILNYLVGVALRGMAVNALYDSLAAGRVSPELHAAIDQELSLHDDPQRWERMLKTERAFSLSTAVDTGLMPQEARINPIWRRIVGWPMQRLYVNALWAFDGQIALARRPWYEARGSIGFRGNVLPKSEFGTLADLLLPAIQAAYDAGARITAMLRALRIFNALTQYRDEHGREASGLDDLSLPKETTIDPFSGEPLKLKHTADGWIIYSVGTNRADDGGDFTDLKDYGLAPAKLRRSKAK